MKSVPPGTTTSPVEVKDIAKDGISVVVRGEEYFLSFDHFPWFRNASELEVIHVEMPSAQHLYWPDLDIDLELESLTNPEKYPLVSQHHREHSTKG